MTMLETDGHTGGNQKSALEQRTESLLSEIDELIRRSNVLRSHTTKLCISQSENAAKKKAASIGQ